ncbi:MAG: von Willebrand factor type A domain-containing protein [Propionibacteriaceae bacterium]|jgi:Ca-activated chloride channel family protein|nr:von Willebrand factor type A domain-containing protein [Propionibacteriaceae bacterium]
MAMKKGAALAAVIGLVAAVAAGCSGAGEPDAADGGAPAGVADGVVAEFDQFGEPVSAQRIVENEWMNVATQPVSTFSADVDTASYTMLRYLLTNGDWYEGMEQNVRIEEMVNYFDYDYPAPAEDAARPFAVDVKLGAAPWAPSHQLARIGVQAKAARPNDNGNNVVLLIDVSGSMGDRDKLPLLVKSFKLLAERFDSKDRVSIVTYASGTSVLLKGVPGTDTGTIFDALESLESGGSTAGSEGLSQAYTLAEANFIADGNNRVILATDGDFNVGPSNVDELKAQITEAREKGVFISVLGFGIHNHDAMMETIADNGNGNYFYIDSLDEARRALVDQFDSTMFTVAKDLKLQVTFNPQTVSQYRLIGYENRVLANEDFADDSVDAGDVGAGATVTALYELIPGVAEPGEEAADAAPTDPADGETAGGTPGAEGEGTEPVEPAPVAAGAWMTVSTRYKEPTGDESVQDDFTVPQDAPGVAEDEDWRFAAAVAEFGMILRGSEHAGEASLSQVKSLAEGALGEDPYGLRAQFLELVDLYEAVSG